MNGPIHSAAPGQLLIGSIHDGIHGLLRDVADDQLQPANPELHLHA
jgi:hypothetical protein